VLVVRSAAVFVAGFVTGVCRLVWNLVWLRPRVHFDRRVRHRVCRQVHRCVCQKCLARLRAVFCNEIVSALINELVIRLPRFVVAGFAAEARRHFVLPGLLLTARRRFYHRVSHRARLRACHRRLSPGLSPGSSPGLARLRLPVYKVAFFAGFASLCPFHRLCYRRVCVQVRIRFDFQVRQRGRHWGLHIFEAGSVIRLVTRLLVVFVSPLSPPGTSPHSSLGPSSILAKGASPGAGPPRIGQWLWQRCCCCWRWPTYNPDRRRVIRRACLRACLRITCLIFERARHQA